MRHLGSRRKLAVHGPVIDLQCTVSDLEQAIELLVGSFAVPSWPEGFTPLCGTIHPYDQAEVTRHLSSNAQHLVRTPDLLDIYEEGERFWLVDDRWGMAEINLLRGNWRSWILPAPRRSNFSVVEQALIWPLAQLIRAKGVHLLPAVSVVRDGFAVLLLCPFGLEPELHVLTAAGYRVIGQRWTALREEDGRVALLHMPWEMQNPSAFSQEPEAGGDLTGPHLADGMEMNGWQNHAFCDAVLVVEAGRRTQMNVSEIAPDDAANVLRSSWPIMELHPNRRPSQLPWRIAQSCRAAHLQLSREPRDLLALLNTMRRPAAAARPRSLAA